MAVTELAIIPLKPGYSQETLDKALLGILHIQDTWVAEHQPSNLRPNCHASAFFVDVSQTPSPLCITATWPSVDGHWVWIKSDGNKACSDVLTDFENTANESMLLFHMAPAMGDSQLQDADLQGAIKIHRLSVSQDGKDKLSAAYNSLLESTGTPGKQWAGWRIEKATPDTEELVVFSTDLVTEQQLQPLVTLADNVQTHQLKRRI